jgi:hypothetical protein
MHRVDEVDRERRRFLGVAAVALGTTWLGAGARTSRGPMAFGTMPQEAPEAFAKAIIDVDYY